MHNKIKLVVAGNKELFRCWCAENNIDPYDLTKARFTDSPQSLQGYYPGDVEIVWGPDYMQQSIETIAEAEELEAKIKACNP